MRAVDRGSRIRELGSWLLIALVALCTAPACSFDDSAQFERGDDDDQTPGGAIHVDAGKDAHAAAGDAGGAEHDASSDAGQLAPGDRTPVARAVKITTQEDTAADGTLDASDADGDELTFEIDAAPTHGTLVLAQSGEFTYTPARDYAGNDVFTFVASDGERSSTPARVEIAITKVNDAPAPAGDALTAAEGGSNSELEGGASSVLANDTDADGDVLTVNTLPVSDVSHGTLTLNSDGTFEYVHDGGESTRDDFAYEVCDDAPTPACSTAAVEITILPVNDAPVLSGGPFYVALPVTTNQKVGTLAVANPEAAQKPTFTVSGGGGHYKINGDGVLRVADAAALNTVHDDTLTVDVADHGSPNLHDSLQVEVHFVTAPVAADDATLEVIAGAETTTFDLTANDDAGSPAANAISFGGDSLGGSVTRYAADGTPRALADGEISLAADGTLSVHAASPGTYTFSYRLSNGMTSDALVSLTVREGLAVGDAITARPEGAGATIRFGGQGSDAAEYLLIPMNLTQGASYPLKVVASNITNLAGSAPALGNTTSATDGHAALRADQHAAVDARRANGGSGTPLNPASKIATGVPDEDDDWSLNVNLSAACTPGTAQAATVRSVGTHCIVVTDDSNPLTGYTDAQLDALAYNFDQVIYPAVTSVLGAPSDIDANDRVVLFVTAAVNRLAAAASTGPYGVALPRDLMAQAKCPTSNQGEILYLIAPDPTGTINGNMRTIANVFSRYEVAHELAHLILDSRRLAAASPFEAAWLDEALAGIGVERATLRGGRGMASLNVTNVPVYPTVDEAGQLTTGQNILVSDLTSGTYATKRVAAFNAFVNTDFSELRWFLQSPARTGFTDSTSNMLSVRGGAYAFLRYAGDRYAAEASQSEALFYQDVVDADSSGIATIAGVTGTDATLWMRDFLTAVYVDDSGIPDLDTEDLPYRIPTWSYRSVYTGLGGFPLFVPVLSSGSAVNLTLGAGGTAAYLRFGVAANTVAAITFTLPASGTYDVWYRIVRID